MRNKLYLGPYGIGGSNVPPLMCIWCVAHWRGLCVGVTGVYMVTQGHGRGEVIQGKNSKGKQVELLRLDQGTKALMWWAE